MTLLRLAWRNLLGAGTRTALNVLVLSLTFVAIVASLGLLEGMNQQTARAMVEAEVGGGQLWHPRYDPFDPLALAEAHGAPPPAARRMIADGSAAAILVVPGTFYPNGRLRPLLLKGIDPGQRVLALPTGPLAADGDEIPILIGQRTARACGLAVGDTVTLQWRDAAGTIDARDARVVEVMRTPVQSVDLNQAWLPLERLRGLAAMPGEATLVVAARDVVPPADAGAWRSRSQDELLADVRSLVRSKAVGAAIVYVLLLFLSMLAIFDTQVLSLFRRRKEIGTLMALGMPRGTVAALFTLEGALHGVLAVVAGALNGAPLLARFARVGWKLSVKADSYGFALGDTLYPVYSLRVVALTLLGLLLVTTFVSFLPTRRIASLQPTEALRGRAG